MHDLDRRLDLGSPEPGAPAPDTPAGGSRRGARRRATLALVAVAASAALVAAPSMLPLGREAGPVPSAEAAAVLRGAADAVAARDAGDLRGARFLYVKSLVSTGTTRVTREVWVGHREPGRRATWASGATAARVEPVPVLPFVLGGASVDWEGLFSLPTEPARLDELLRRSAAESGADADALAFQAVGDLAETPAPPALLAAVYRVAAMLPGVRLVGATRDAAGRRAVAVERDGTASGTGVTRYLVDRRTGRLLQVEREPDCPATAPGPDCEPQRSTYLVSAPVDALGRRPPSR